MYEELAVFARTWGLVYLLVLFGGALVYALWPSAKEKFAKAARIPLEED